MRTLAGPLLIPVLILFSACGKRNPEERAMSPEDSLKAMHLSEDFHVELFAREPEVMSPVEMAFDENGKIYVAEMFDYPEDPPPGKPARSRIRLLEDTDGDGKIDRSTIFAENVLAADVCRQLYEQAMFADVNDQGIKQFRIAELFRRQITFAQWRGA